MKKSLFFIIINMIILAASLNAEVADTSPIDAMNVPSRHAWNLFLKLNHPAKDPDKLRGIPDPQKRVGDNGLTVWETWKSAGSEVFFPDGRHPGAWEDMTSDNAPTRPKQFELTKPTIINAVHFGIPISDATSKSRLLQKLRANTKAKNSIFKSMAGSNENLLKALEDMLAQEVDEDGIFLKGGGETRMNKSTYDFIVNNGLYNVEGQESLFEQITKQGRAELSFPVDSIEVKSMWIALEPEDLKPGGKAERYHQGKGVDGKTYGLVALHIITKDIPKWFWCSFRQIDGPEPEIKSVDSYGRPSSLNGSKWQYYELSGTQTDFTDAIGRPTLLSDPHIENGFQKTSCITCHAFSTIGAPSNQPTGDRFPFFAFADPSVPVPSDATLDPESRFPIGTPPTSVFFKDADRKVVKYIQLDFVFSTAFRARRAQTRMLSATEHLVRVSEFRYDPAEITIKVGDSIIFVNDGRHAHNAVLEGNFRTPMLKAGERSDPIKFDTPSPAEGLEYHCGPHPFMKGRIKVLAR